jgi:hypothetical protein
MKIKPPPENRCTCEHEWVITSMHVTVEPPKAHEQKGNAADMS